MKRIGVLLSGCGVYDGAEIQESVLTMLAIEEANAEYFCISVDKPQYHTVNHLTGDEEKEPRNMLVESARIARGDVIDISKVDLREMDALVIPGGFGSAKNFTKWAFEGPEGKILPEIKLLLINLVNIGKPILALCVSPVVLAKAFEGGLFQPKLTIGSVLENSPYSIEEFKNGMESIGVESIDKSVEDILIDSENKVITAPCYMMNASILEVRNNIKKGVEALVEMID
jgi:enhancing lycopene biosynthesis protein 2